MRLKFPIIMGIGFPVIMGLGFLVSWLSLNLCYIRRMLLCDYSFLLLWEWDSVF